MRRRRTAITATPTAKRLKARKSRITSVKNRGLTDDQKWRKAQRDKKQKAYKHEAWLAGLTTH